MNFYLENIIIMQSRSPCTHLYTVFNKAVNITNKLLQYNTNNTHYTIITSIAKNLDITIDYIYLHKKLNSYVHVTDILHIDLYEKIIQLASTFISTNLTHINFINKRIVLPTCERLHTMCSIAELYNAAQHPHCRTGETSNVVLIANGSSYPKHPKYPGCYFGINSHVYTNEFGSRQVFANDIPLKWYPVNCNYKQLVLQSVTKNHLVCSCHYNRKK